MTELFLYDRTSDTTTSVWAHNFGGGFAATLSDNGRYLAFASSDSVVPEDGNDRTDVYVYEVSSGLMNRVSVDSTGGEGNLASSSPSISSDGRLVAFWSDATNLVSGDTNNYADVFVHDRLTGTTTRVSVDSSGAEANGSSLWPSISSDGSAVGFQSYGTNLVPGDTNGWTDLFVHDLQSGSTTRVNLDYLGGQLDEACFGPLLSGDGRFAAFTTVDPDVLPGDDNGTYDAFLRDRLAGTTTRVSVDSSGLEGDGQSWATAIDADGDSVLFYSQATQLVAADTNGTFDVFVHDTGLSCSPLATYCTAKVNSQGCTPIIGASGVPSLSSFDAFFLTAEQVLNNQFGMLIWSLTRSATPFAGGTLCLGGPIRRTPPQHSAGNPPPSDCTGTYSFHFDQAFMSAQGITAGTRIYAQYWSRDNGFPPPNNVGLSGGIQFTVCP
jgi:Tol biopolymer transport system component